MTRMLKVGLLAGASALVLGLAAMPNQANAFEKVKWEWTGNVDTNIEFDANIDLGNVTPDGMTMVEDIQVSIGDIRAVSKVSGIDNNQPSNSPGGPVTVDLGVLEFTGVRDGTTGEVSGTPATDVLTDATFLNGTVNTVGFGVTANFDLGSIVVDAPAGDGSFDALTELPSVVSAATAVANNTSIESEVATQVHEFQAAVGGTTGPISSPDVLGVLNVLTPGKVTAISKVDDILNASVDSTATAVSNNLTVDVAAAGPDDSVLIMDAQQWSFMDVKALSKVEGVELFSYTNLGAIDVPIVNSVATAIGNNKSITVSVPAVGAPAP